MLNSLHTISLHGGVIDTVIFKPQFAKISYSELHSKEFPAIITSPLIFVPLFIIIF